jgi:diguanylate cyclase (GGDEF)-like protein
VPLELLVGVLLLSVVANAALIFRLSRSAQVRVRWPSLSGSLDSYRARSPQLEPPAPRRRSLFVAQSSNPPERATAEPVAASATPGLPVARAPLSRTLPPDLADFLSRPATIAPGAEGAGFARYGDGPDRTNGPGPAGPDEDGAVMAVQARVVSSGLTVDSLTGLEGPASWSRIIEIENARLMRYRRPVTVVMVEVEGLRRLAERLGDDPVDRLLPVIADALRREARATDWVARIGDGRFAAFLPETDEIQAINYVERIRLVCEPWLASAAVPLWLAIGWSGPTASSDLEFALLRAEDRMHADRRMPGRSIQLPRVVPSRVVAVSRNGSATADSAVPDGTSVSPAETGRSGEWIAQGIRPAGPSDEQIAAVPSGNRHRKAPRAAAAPDRRTEA